MVTITDYKTYLKEDGTEFQALVVQGQIEAVKSKKTGKNYFTARTAKVPCTFDKATCKTLKGTEFPGKIIRIEVAPYQYALPETDEVITLSHRYEYLNDQETVIEDNVVETAAVL